MTAQELYQGLLLAGFETAYREFKSAPALPYIVYYFTESADIMADNTNYHGLGDWHVELYASGKDLAAEAAVETQLRALGLAWSKLETAVETEDMYETLYTIRLIS